MRQSRPRPSSRVSRTWQEVPTLSSQVYLNSTFLTDKGCAPARAAVDCPITTSGAAPLIVDGFRRVRRSTFTAAPDAPERIDHRRRCTRLDHRTCCRGSRRERVPTVPHVAKTRRNVPRRIAPGGPILNATTSPLYARRYTGASSPRWSLYARIAAPIGQGENLE